MSLKHIFLEFSRQLNGCAHVANYEAMEEHQELLNEHQHLPRLTYRYMDVSERVLNHLPPELARYSIPSIYCLAPPTLHPKAVT